MKIGFGDVITNFWIGNDCLNALTSTGWYKLHVDVQSAVDHQWYWAEYTTFVVGNDTSKYRLRVGGYSGTAGDAMKSINTQLFATIDQDIGGCAAYNCAAFWYLCGGTKCHINNGCNGISWGPLPPGSAVKSSRMYFVNAAC